MGDTTTVYFIFGGTISRRAAELLCEELDNYSFTRSRDEAKPSVETLAPNPGEPSTWCADEVNYASTDEIDAICHRYKIWYQKSSGSGWEYGESIERFVEGRLEEMPFCDGEPMVSLRRVIETDTLATGLADLIDLARWMRKPLPDLVIVDAIEGEEFDEEDEVLGA